MEDLSTILHEAKYKEAMLDLKRRPIRRIPELPRTLSSRKVTGMADVDLHTLIKEPIGVWFLRKFADLEYKLAHTAEEQRGTPLSRATDSAGLIDDILDDTTSVSSFSDDSSIHGLPDQHEATFLKFVNAFYARKRADPSNSVSRSIVVLLIRHYDLDILEPVLRGLSAHGFDPAVQKTLASVLDEAMAHDSGDAAAIASSSDEGKDSESGPDRATQDDEDELIGANDENASRSDFPVPELLKKASTIVDHPDDEFHSLLRVRRLPGSVGSIDFPASREEAFGCLPDHLDPLEQDENDHGNQDDQELDGEVDHEIDDDDDDDDDAYSISDFPDGHEADEGTEATRALKNGADDDADSNGRRTSRVGETDRRRFSSTFSDLPLTSAVTKLRRANSINHLRAQERRRQIVSLRKLHSERTIGLNEAIEVLISTVCEPMFLRFCAHKASMRNYCRIKSFAMRPVQDSHFTKLRVLGRGATGRVYACMHMHTGRPMAMKVMPKKLVKFRRTFSQVKSERRVLEALANKPSPYCMRLLYAYQTKESFHFVLPLAIAGDLRFHLSKGPLPHKRALVYAAEIAHGLGHIHSLGYVMRDLKPRNILLDARGRCRISDFGLAVNVGNGKLIRGRAGTVGYWSPQVLSGERYGQDADWWSYGVCVYELFAGFNPFSRRFTGYSSRNEATLHAPVHYPPGFPKRVALFVSQLLERDVQERLGCLGGGANEVLDPEHGIWKPLDLDTIRTATHEPVWTPDSGVVYAESESEIAANEERKLPDVHKVKVLPSDMPEFDDFVAIFDHMTDISRVLSFHVDEKALQADILNRYRRGKLPLDASDAELMRSNSKCLLM